MTLKTRLQKLEQRRNIDPAHRAQAVIWRPYGMQDDEVTGLGGVARRDGETVDELIRRVVDDMRPPYRMLVLEGDDEQ